MRSLVTRTLLGALSLAVLGAACTVKDTEAPALAGPSSFATDLALQASPDQIYQDGREQSAITITARGPNNQPVRSLAMRVEMTYNGQRQDFGTLSTRSVVTGDDGVARLTYTAPPRPVDSSGAVRVVTIEITPLGTDYAGANTHTVDIRLVPPGVILPPPGDPPAGDFSFSPSAPSTFTPVFFNASGIVCGSGCGDYSWNFGDGGTANGVNVTHEFRAPGTFAVTLFVTDLRGQGRMFSKSVTAAPGTAPTATYVYSPTAPHISQDIFFTAEASRAANGRRIVAYDWNFGSGRTATGVTTSKRYDTSGSYVVTLTVTDDAGQQGTVSQTIVVVP